MSLVPPAVRRGVRDASPIAVGYVPFALVAGASAMDAGLSPSQAVGLSVVVYAGAAQLAVIDLLGSNAELAVVFLTAVVINLRMTMYSASIAPHFRAFAARSKAVASYLLTDQAYALAIARYAQTGDGGDASDGETAGGAAHGGETGEGGADTNAAARLRYYLGAALLLWTVWQVCTVLGVVLGASVPASWGLSFAVPLVFLALLVPAVSARPGLAAAVVGGSVAVAGEVVPVGGMPGLPYNLGLLFGAVAGVVAGVAASALADGPNDGDDAEEARH